MIPVDQTKPHIPGKSNGNCLPAALASIFEMTLQDIPSFEDMPDSEWYAALRDWLYNMGFQLLGWKEEIHFDGYYIVNGRTSRDTDHSVVYKKGQMVHDPHTLRDGLTKITSVWAFLPHSPAVERSLWVPQKGSIH